jgi:hypothetical protein
MSTASSKPPTPNPAKGLPEFFRDYQQRFGNDTPGSSASAPAERKRRRAPKPADSPAPQEPWQQRLRAWLVGPDGRAFGTSLIFHTLLLVCLSLLALKSHGHGESFGVSMGSGESGGDGFDLENVLDQGFDAPQGNVEFQTAPAIDAPTAAPAAIRPEVDLAGTLAALEAPAVPDLTPSELLQGVPEGGPSGRGRGRGVGSGIGDGIGNLTSGFSKPGGGRAVKRGKFTAWTVPADPQPFQNYLIVIEVDWPKVTNRKMLRDRKNDLTGTVKGSDNYLQVIEKSGFFIPKSNQMVVPVPGAEQNVRDEIQVHSKILEESQDLTITF